MVDMIATPDSSNVAAIGYDPLVGQCYVDFKNGSSYCYQGVAEAVWSAFLDAESKGSFVHANLKNVYETIRLA